MSDVEDLKRRVRALDGGGGAAGEAAKEQDEAQP